MSQGYSVNFEPIVKIGENLELLQGGSRKSWHKVTYIEPLPASSPLMVDFGALSAGASSSKTLVTAIQIDDGYFVQLRAYCLDDIRVQLWELANIPRYYIKNSQALITRFSRLADPTLLSTQFFVLGNNKDAYMTATNPTDYDTNNSRIVFMGWKYLIEPLTAEPTYKTTVPTEGRS